MSATPQADPERVRQRIILQGELPSPFSPPPGCTFHPRCPLMKPVCREIRPELLDKVGRMVACFAVLGASDRGTQEWHSQPAPPREAAA
jgi:dipeptide transport system ATP-binding protein